MKRTLRIFCTSIVITVLCSCTKGFFVKDFESGFYNGVSYEGMPDENEGMEGDRYDEIIENEFINTGDEPTSTFSVDCDGASYANMRRFIREGSLPYRNSVRIEEFLNYFTFDYAEPEAEEVLSMNSELASCPWNSEHKLLRLGIKGQSLKTKPLSNYVFLIDVSGSMNSKDKLELLKNGMTTLVDQLNPNDRVSIITYSGSVKKLLESTLASDGRTIKKAISKLTASGSTNGGEAMKMAYEEALENFITGGNNRIVMGTDGDFNVGVTRTDELKEMVENYAKKGIYITICGFGRGNLNDGMIETVTNAGNGTYEYIDSEDEITKVFVNDFGKFFAVANDVKAQVTFDPAVVKSYRLIGYENRVLSNSDFENDEKDASEIGSGQTITALYELIMNENAPISAGKFSIRYKKTLGTESLLLESKLPSEEAASLSPNMALASGCAAYGLVLRDSKFKGIASIPLAYDLVSSSLSFDPHGYRAQFAELIQKANTLE